MLLELAPLVITYDLAVTGQEDAVNLDNDEIRNVLARASEIQDGAEPSHVDVETLMLAAEEVGISRAAVERALRERMLLPSKPPVVGQLSFARSADDKYYVAEVVSAAPEGFTVRFLRGGQHTVQLDDLRPCSFLPGERVVVNWPWWGPWTCTVLSHDASERRIMVTDGWGETREFSIRDVWIAPRRKIGSRRNRLIGALLAAATAGVGLGAYLASLFGA